MGNQRKHKQARQAKEALKNGAVTTVVKDPPTPALIAAPVVVATTKVIPATNPATTKEPMTKAGVTEYNDFFGLYAKSVREKKTFRSLGFIPGPAMLVDFGDDGQIQILAATPDVAKGFQTLPTPWMKEEELPEKIRQALKERRAVAQGLGYDSSPYNLAFARGVLEGRVPPKFLAMVMPHFRYQPGDPELPFGVVLTTAEGGMKVKTFNPYNIPNVPKDDTVMTLDELKNSRGPIQKLLRTWALMEGNYLGRYDRDGNRRPANGQGTQPQPQFRRPTI